MKRVVTVIGARPQFIKAAPLCIAFRAHGGFEHHLLHTGQHQDGNMSDVFFEQLAIDAPRWHLGICGGDHGEMTGPLLPGIEVVLKDQRPDLVVVLGDTNSTLAGALAALKLAIPVAHVEAGLRSHRAFQPEEINRRMVDSASQILLCPTATALATLRSEGRARDAHFVGDVMYDVALLAGTRDTGLLDTHGLAPDCYDLVTLHRAENVDNEARLRRLLDHVRDSAEGKTLVFPIHPRTRRRTEQFGIRLDGFLVLDPLGYLEMSELLRHAHLLFTDSGGLQKEAYFNRTPAITLRDETEWTETVENGWNRLWHSPAWAPRREFEAYGDGRAAEKSVAVVHHYLQ